MNFHINKNLFRYGVLSFGMFLVPSISVNAAGTTTYQQIEVTYSQPSTFSVDIPKSIVLNSDQQSKYSIQVNGDIAFNQEVSVTPIDEIADTEAIDFYMADQTPSSTKENAIATINQNKNTWSCEDVTNNYEETENKITATNLTAGEWKGTFQVAIELITHEVAEAPEVSIAPSEAYLNWNYTLDDTDKTITLNYYTGNETNVTVYGGYDVNGTVYQTKIKSNNNNSYSNYMFANKSNIESITFKDDVNTSNVTSMSYMFNNCTSLKNIDVSNFNTSNVTDMQGMFDCCSSLTQLDVSNFNTSNVTNMQVMFYNCVKLESIDVTNFNTSKVTSMQGMFGSANGKYMSLTEIIGLNNFDTSNVTTMESMFCNCILLTNLDLSNFNTSKVTSMFRMFNYCTHLTNLDIINFDTSNVTNMQQMFFSCASLTTLDLSSFDTIKATDMSHMFENCKKLEKVYVTSGKWNTSNADIYFMFNNCDLTSSVTYK